jgi:hypothetical protein
MKNKYKVIGTGTYFADLAEAVAFAKEKAMSAKKFDGASRVIVNTENCTFVACVTDDANGVTVNKLSGWPIGYELPA